MRCSCSRFASQLETFADVEARIAATSELLPTLDEVASDSAKWLAILRCRVCSALWAKEYPFSERHGGGPVCLYQIPTCDPHAWLASNDGMTHIIRERHEDTMFFNSLGDESGDAVCRNSDCSNKTTQHSVFCRLHHFEMIKGRPFR